MPRQDRAHVELRERIGHEPPRPRRLHLFEDQAAGGLARGDGALDPVQPLAGERPPRTLSSPSIPVKTTGTAASLMRRRVPDRVDWRKASLREDPSEEQAFYGSDRNAGFEPSSLEPLAR
jgi:hypothetical protein